MHPALLSMPLALSIDNTEKTRCRVLSMHPLPTTQGQRDLDPTTPGNTPHSTRKGDDMEVLPSHSICQLMFKPKFFRLVMLFM
mmetsp:Transcript_553/g.1091  ORF Transcript_553/g.1091 Transcript_553/m.1091 type:complete len:83 (-) Transcript_553:2966-3214(-)